MIQVNFKKNLGLSAKKKIAAAIGAGAIFAASFLPALAAQHEAGVSATVTAQLVAVSVADGSVAYGAIDLNNSEDTTTSGVDDTQTATNDGNVNEDFGIRSSDAVSGGTDWDLAAATGIIDEFTHEFCTVDCDGTPTWNGFNVDNTTYSSMVTGVASSGTQDFDLQIGTPTSSTDTVEHTITVTVQATAS